MAWIDRPAQAYTMFKSNNRPIIDIPPAHRDPLRTPEDAPLRVPWISTQINDDLYHFDVEHNRFPDVADAGWAMGMISPPSPSRRNSLELLPDVGAYPGESDVSHWEAGMASPSRRNSLELPTEDVSNPMPDIDEPPILSPPSPSMHSLAELPDTDSEWPPAPDLDCPQLSPPSPINRGGVLPPLEFETHSLFIEDAPIVDSPQFPPDTPLRAEHRALLSLRDRTMNTERTSRARNKALRGRERELGRLVAALRATSDPNPAALHAYRTTATHVMLERIEEKRRRKHDKERLKEIRVLLGTGVDALLSTEGHLAFDATTDLGMGPDAAPGGGGLGLALHAPPSDDDRMRALAERTHMMRRLVACMTMRRRDLGMRSLVEAGNMAEEAGERPVCAPCQRSGLAHEILGEPGGGFENDVLEKGSERVSL